MVGKCPRCIRGNTFIDFVRGTMGGNTACNAAILVQFSRVTLAYPRIRRYGARVKLAREFAHEKIFPGVMPREKGARNIVITGSGSSSMEINKMGKQHETVLVKCNKSACGAQGFCGSRNSSRRARKLLHNRPDERTSKDLKHPRMFARCAQQKDS